MVFSNSSLVIRCFIKFNSPLRNSLVTSQSAVESFVEMLASFCERKDIEQCSNKVKTTNTVDNDFNACVFYDAGTCG